MHQLFDRFGEFYLLCLIIKRSFQIFIVCVQVCSDLISHYPVLFNVDNTEVEKERRMLEVLEQLHFPTPSSMKRSGDIRMWVYIESRSGGQCISLVLHPSLTAGEACTRYVIQGVPKKFVNL